MLGERIKQARKAKGWALRDLASRVDLSPTIISKYERNLATPSSDVLLALSKALDVRTEYFFRKVDVRLENISYRNHEKLPAKLEARILSDVKDQLERWSILNDVLPAPWAVDFSLPEDLPETIETLDEIEDVAVQVRKHWNLGLNPIPDLIDTLECKGVLVFQTDFDHGFKFEGLSTRANGQPVVVVGKSWPGDRQRFTLAHEIGHLTLDSRISRKIDEEAAANRFAGAFLAPRDKVKECLGERRKALETYELYLLKHEFGLSIAGWSYRALNLGIINKSTHQAFWGMLVEKGWNITEPGEPCQQETPRLFEQTIYRAMSEGLISESKAAELMKIKLYELTDRRQMLLDKDNPGADHGDIDM